MPSAASCAAAATRLHSPVTPSACPLRPVAPPWRSTVTPRRLIRRSAAVASATRDVLSAWSHRSGNTFCQVSSVRPPTSPDPFTFPFDFCTSTVSVSRWALYDYRSRQAMTLRGWQVCFIWQPVLGAAVLRAREYKTLFSWPASCTLFPLRVDRHIKGYPPLLPLSQLMCILHAPASGVNQ